MSDVITALSTTITQANLWAVITGLVPFIGVVFLFSLGLYFLRKVVKGGAKGKVKF